MYIQSVNYEQHNESTGLWAPRILTQTESGHQQKFKYMLRLSEPYAHEMEQLIFQITNILKVMITLIDVGLN
jgi:hypothetical protein